LKFKKMCCGPLAVSSRQLSAVINTHFEPQVGLRIITKSISSSGKIRLSWKINYSPSE